MPGAAACVRRGFSCRYWGGGVFCADNTGGLPAAPMECYDEMGAQMPEGSCFSAQIVPNCNGNGEVLLPYGSAEYVGLGFSVFATLVLVELFGSPAMRNVQVRHGSVTCMLSHGSFVDRALAYKPDRARACCTVHARWVQTSAGGRPAVPEAGDPCMCATLHRVHVSYGGHMWPC